MLHVDVPDSHCKSSPAIARRMEYSALDIVRRLAKGQGSNGMHSHPEATT